MSAADPTPARGVPSPGTAVDEETRPGPLPVPANGPAEDEASATSTLAQAGARAWQRAGQIAEQGWQRSTPKAEWLTRKTAPLTRRAAQTDLVQVAAGVAVTALAAVVMALAAQVQWEVGVLTAPLWLFVGAALLAGTVLGPWRALLAVGLYLVLGLVGAAWTGAEVAEHTGGPWAGVLFSLPLAALVAGAISARHSTLRSPVTPSWYFFGWFFFAALSGMAVAYAGGLWTLFQRMDVDGWMAFTTMSARLPFDVAQCVLVATLAALVHRFVPGLLRSARPRRRP